RSMTSTSILKTFETLWDGHFFHAESGRSEKGRIGESGLSAHLSPRHLRKAFGARFLIWAQLWFCLIKKGFISAFRKFYCWSCFFSRRDSPPRSEEHTSELQSRFDLVCRLLLEKKNTH